MTHPGGYQTAQEYAAAIEREARGLDRREERIEQEQERRQQSRVPQQPGTQGAISGPMRDPSNPRRGLTHEQRYEQARKIAGPEISAEVDRQLWATEAANTLRDWYRVGADEDDASTAERIAEFVVNSGDPELAAGVATALENVGADYMLDSVREFARMKVSSLTEAQQKAHQEAHETRIAGRELMLQDELDRLDPRDAEPVAQMMDTYRDGFYNDPPLEVVMAARTIGEQAKAQRQGLESFSISAAIGEEIKRGVGAPGSSWSDSERDRWRAEMDQASLEVLDRKVPEADPMASFDRAERSVLNADQDPFAASIVRELDTMIDRQEPDHQTVERMKERSPEKYIPTGERGSEADPYMPERTGPM